MNAKMWTLIAIAIVGAVLFWTALHYSGESGKAKGALVCAQGNQNAADAALAKQHREDLKAMDQLKTMLSQAQGAAVRAAQQAGVAQARADALSATLDSLKKSNPDVKAWSDTRLPGELLRSMHSQTGMQAGDGIPDAH